ncbi:MAG: hypothetical protein IPF99_30980 [Deltaproteobacteria bacterium]|nr:hypothetical protein [Deltaproteobacteria bacterium]
MLTCVNYDQGFSERRREGGLRGPSDRRQRDLRRAELLGRHGVAGLPLRDGQPHLDGSPGLALPLVPALGQLDTCASDDRACFRRDCETAGGMFLTGP